MFLTVVRLAISFLVTNWIYSEAVLFCPPLDSFAQKVYRSSKLPTHDKWGKLADSRSADALGLTIEREITKSAPDLGFSFASFFDRNVRTLWSQGRLASMGDFAFGGIRHTTNRSFLSGQEIFARRIVAQIQHTQF